MIEDKSIDVYKRQHLLGNLSVQPAYTVHFLRSVTGEYGHAEAFALVAGVVAAERCV